MAKYRFVATHGVQFGEDTGDGYRTWASFDRERDLDTPEGEKRYVFETNDPAIAARVRKADGYGIVEDKPASKGDGVRSSG